MCIPNVLAGLLRMGSQGPAVVDSSAQGLAALASLLTVAVVAAQLILTDATTSRSARHQAAALLLVQAVFVFLLLRTDAADPSGDRVWAAALCVLCALSIAALIRRFQQSRFRLPQESDADSSLADDRSLRETQVLLSLEQYMMESLVNNMPDSIYFKDAESRFIRCNQRTADIFQLASPEDAIGKTDYDFFSRAEADEYRADEIRIIETGEPVVNKEEYELWPDGEYHWVLSTKLPLRDANQRIIGTFGLSRDISELKRAQQDLAAKVEELEALHAEYSREQNLFRSLIDNIPDAVFFKDRESRFIRVNPAMAREAGFDSVDELIGLTDADIWQAEVATEARSDELRIMESGEPVIGKLEELRAQKKRPPRWVLATKMPLKDTTGETIGTFGLARDITTLRLTQQWLSDSQERFELAVNGTNDGLWDWNVQTDKVWYAPRFRELLHYDSRTTDDFPDVLASFQACLHPDDRGRVMDSIYQHLDGGPPHDEEYRLKLSSGQYRWFRGRGQAKWDAAGTPVRMAGSIQDIHEQHETQAALKQLQLQLQQALEGGNVGMWNWDVMTDQVEVSPELMLQIGEDPQRPWRSLADWEYRLHPDDLEAAKQRTLDYIQGLTAEYESSFRLRHADGSYRWILSRGRLFRNQDGQPRRFIGVHVDVTELRIAEQALADSEAKFRGIFNQTFQFIGLLTPDGIVVDANQAALNGAGVSRDAVVGKRFEETVWWSHSEELRNRLRVAIDTAASGAFDRFEAVHPAPDGSTIIVDFSLKPVVDENGKVVWLIPEGRDVTELKRYQEELRARSEELERSNRELEQFAYVASHDLQEPLRTVVGFAQLLETDCGSSLAGDAKQYLGAIVDGGRRMQQLVADLLEYSRVGLRGKPFERVSLNGIVEQAQLLLYTAIEESEAEIRVGDLPDVAADAGQMTRVFQNVIGNAIKYRRDVTPLIRIWSETHQDSVHIFVSDNGIGIKEEFAEQVFVIFRRLHTREEFPGTGIGLAVCRRIVERHGGTITVCFERNSDEDDVDGTTFRITLPTAQSSA